MATIGSEAKGHPASRDVESIAPMEITQVQEKEFDGVKEESGPDNIGTLERRLKSRHIQFLALSGAIGTGLFVGSGQVLSLAGPLSAFLSYLITGFNLYCVIVSLGEMSAWLPVPGAVGVFASRYVDPSLGFAVQWSYWYQNGIGVPIEISAAAVVLDYWPAAAAHISQAALITVFLVPMIVINCLPVRMYGEAEFAFGAIKLTTIIGLLILMFLISVGGVTPDHKPIGFKYWSDPGPMNAYLVPGALGRFLAFFKVFINATFSYGGSELVVVAGGECENPRRNIPKAVRRVFWRVGIFYVLSVFLVGLCTSSQDPNLLNAITNSVPGAGQSPFVIAIQNAGIRVLPSIINGVVLTSAWSAGNSFFYASTRVLYSAALDGKTPAFLKFERFGVPYAAVAATTVLSLLVYLNVNNASSEVFWWFSNISGASTLVVWMSVCFTYVRFHAALKHNGVDRATLPYKGWGQPYLAWFSIIFCGTVALFNGFDSFFPGKFSAKSFLPAYINIPIFLALFFGYKFVNKAKWVKLEDIDIWTGKAEIDRLEPLWVVPQPRNFLERMWFWIA